MRVAFILPGRGGGGGAHSVVQETIGLRRYGVDASIATTRNTYADFSTNYPELDQQGVSVILYDEPAQLEPELQKYDIVVATAYESAYVLEAARGTKKENAFKTAYYVQDYEPLFRAPGTKDWELAYRSYTLDPHQVLFAKTRWLCDVVRANHGRTVEKVRPSIDHATYFPGRRNLDKPPVISAMVRPSTPPRAPRRTGRILERLASQLAETTQFIAFGSSKSELASYGIGLSDRVQVRDYLSRRDVAAVLRVSDLFLDLSDYQAFGRTGLEAMACGCVALVPCFGGADEYAKAWENALVVDTRDEDAIVDLVQRFLDQPHPARARMRSAAIATALDYTIEKSAFSEAELFERIVAN